MNKCIGGGRTLGVANDGKFCMAMHPSVRIELSTIELQTSATLFGITDGQDGASGGIVAGGGRSAAMRCKMEVVGV